MKADVVWRDKMAFDLEVDGHTFTIDAADAHGGRDLGPRPKSLLLAALAGCTAMDVRAILDKMRVVVDGLSVRASGELAEEHPRRFVSAHVIYDFRGSELPIDKLRRAVMLSEQRYCGVNATLSPTVVLTSELRVNGQVLADDGEAPARASAAATAS